MTLVPSPQHHPQPYTSALRLAISFSTHHLPLYEILAAHAHPYALAYVGPLLSRLGLYLQLSARFPIANEPASQVEILFFDHSPPSSRKGCPSLEQSQLLALIVSPLEAQNIRFQEPRSPSTTLLGRDNVLPAIMQHLRALHLLPKSSSKLMPVCIDGPTTAPCLANICPLNMWKRITCTIIAMYRDISYIGCTSGGLDSSSFRITAIMARDTGYNRTSLSRRSQASNLGHTQAR